MNTMIVSSKFIGKMAPIYLIISYLIFGFLIFLFSPFNWKIDNQFLVVIYFTMILISIIIGFNIPLKKESSPVKAVNYSKIILWGTTAALIVLVPATFLYSGKYPWQIFSLLADQSDAYTTYQDRLRDSSAADRTPVALLRTILHPLVFATLPLAFLHWKELKLSPRLGAITVILSLLIISVARGTDRETFDIIIFVFTCNLIVYFRKKNCSVKDLPKTPRKIRTAMIIVFLLALMAAVFYVFVERKLGRFGGDLSRVCVGSDQDICITNLGSGRILGDWGTFAWGMIAGYISAGYYGLNLAMGLDFQSTLGTGSSPLVARYYEMISGDNTLYLQSYTYRMRAMGWSDEYTWSTLMVWLANDVGFFGALLLIFLLAMLFGASWRDAVLASDDRAAIVFVLLFLMFFYLPANNQVGQSLDLSLAFFFWLYRWRYHKYKK